MASISRLAGSKFSDGKPRYRAQYRDAVGHQIVRQFTTRRDAQAFVDQAAHDLVAGVLPDSKAGRQTLAELFEEVNGARSFAPSTRALRQTAWGHIPEAMRRSRINVISSVDVDRVLSNIAAPAMREKTRQLLSTLFSWAIAKRKLKVNPAKRTPIRKTRAEKTETASPRDEKRYLKTDELARLIAEIPDRYKAMVRVMAYVGLRPGEAYALTVGQIETSGKLRIDRSIAGPTKTGETRSITLPEIVREWLADHVESFVPTRWDDPDALLFGKIDPDVWRRRVFAPAVRAAGLEKIRINDLRHTAVSFAVGHGASVYDVQRMVGHAKPSITLDIYGQLWDEGADRLAGQLDTAIRALG